MKSPEAEATAAARAELYDTLGQLRSRLDYAQRIDDSVAEVKRNVVRQRAEKPLAFAAGVVSVAALTGLAVWGLAQAVIRTLD